MARKATTEEFIKKSIEIYGLLYDYSLVEYVKSKTKVKIICEKHGLFEQSPQLHHQGRGCQKCSREKSSLDKSKSQEYVIFQFKEKHGNRYDYSLVNYKNNLKRVKIICPDHGVFEKQPKEHIKGSGCPKCLSIRKATKMRTMIKSIERKSKETLRDEFIKKATDRHGERYNYSLVKYTKSNKKVKIICSIHDIFEQTPRGHLVTNGCSKCSDEVGAIKKTLTLSDFIYKANQIHNNKFDYSLVTYKKSKIKVKIICPDHGVFEQTPSDHLNSKGCSKCGRLSALKYQVKKKNVLINQFYKIHKNRYDYSFVNYIGHDFNVSIICREHGVFRQSPASHLSGNGCAICGKKTSIRKRTGLLTKTQDDFLKECYSIYGDKYDYSYTKYIGALNRIKVNCHKHGFFYRIASEHLRGSECKACSKKEQQNKFKDNFLKRSFKKHGDTYDYSLINYISGEFKVKIICKKHGEFEQNPQAHSAGSGCPECCSGGFNSREPAILYYIRIEKDGDTVYKIGITNNNVKKRFKEEYKYITEIMIKEYKTGQEALDMEQSILREYRYAKYQGKAILRSGNTEMFNYDILDLDMERRPSEYKFVDGEWKKVS